MNRTTPSLVARAAIAWGLTLLAPTLCSPAVGSPLVLLDQNAPSNPNAGGWTLSFSTRELAQTFPVTIDGFLDSVEIYVNHQANIDGTMSWDVRPAAGGIPAISDATALAGGTIPISSLPTYWDRTPVRLDVADGHIRVRPGDMFAVTIRVTGAGGAYWLYHDASSPGEMYARFGSTTAWSVNTFSPNSAYGFATYVAPVPEPTCAALAVLLLAPTIVRRGRPGFARKTQIRRSWANQSGAIGAGDLAARHSPIGTIRPVGRYSLRPRTTSLRSAPAAWRPSSFR